MSEVYTAIYTKKSGIYEPQQLLTGRVPLNSEYSFIYINNIGSTISIPDNDGVMIYTGSSILGWDLKQRFSVPNTTVTTINGNKDGSLLLVGAPTSNLVIPLTGDLNSTYSTGPSNNLATFIPNNSNLNNFGNSIAVDKNGNIIVIGEPRSVGNGRIFIFNGAKNLGWNLVQTISGAKNLNTSKDNFGYSIDITNDAKFIAVGAPDINTTFIYSRQGANDLKWSLKQILTGENNSQFGKRVVIGENSSSLFINNNKVNSTDIYTLSDNNWTFDQRINGRNHNVNGYDYVLGALSNPLNETLIPNFFNPGAPSCDRQVISNFVNNFNYPLTIKISGIIDDDLIVNGVIYESGMYPFGGWQNGLCGYSLPINGAHAITPLFLTLDPGESVLIEGISYGGNLSYTLKLEQSNLNEANEIFIYNKDCIHDSYVTNDTKISLKNETNKIFNINDSWLENSGIFKKYNYLDKFNSPGTAGAILNIKNDDEFYISKRAVGGDLVSVLTGGEYSGFTNYIIDYSTNVPYDPVLSDYSNTKQEITIKQFKYENTGYKVTFAFDESWASFNLSGAMNANNAFSWNFKILENIDFSGNILYENVIQDPSLNPIDIFKETLEPKMSRGLVNIFESFQTVCKFKLGCDEEQEEKEPGFQQFCWTGANLETQEFRDWLKSGLVAAADILVSKPQEGLTLLESVGVDLYFTTLSGYILYNDWIDGEQIVWNLYNFDYPKIYKIWHLNNNPPYPSTGFVMTYPRDWNSLDSLVSGLNQRLNSPVSHPVWYPYPCTSGEPTGIFIEGPLMRFWKNTGTTGDGLPLSHVNNRIDFISNRNLPQVTISNEFLTRKFDLFEAGGMSTKELKKITGNAIASTESILDTAYKFELVTFDGFRGPAAYQGYRYLLPKTIILEGLDRSSNLWEELDKVDFQKKYESLVGTKELPYVKSLITGIVKGVLTRAEIDEWTLTGKPELITETFEISGKCNFRNLLDFQKTEQIASKNIYCPPTEKITNVTFVWPEDCPNYIVSGTSVIEVDRVYWCNPSEQNLTVSACEEPFVVECPPGWISFLCEGECLGDEEPCPYYSCENPLSVPGDKYIPLLYTWVNYARHFSKNAGFNDPETNSQVILPRCGEELNFKAFKEFRVRFINFFASKNHLLKYTKQQIIKEELLPHFLTNSFQVQNISFIDALNVPLNGHIGEAECFIGSDYEVRVSGLTPLKFTGIYDVYISGQEYSGQYKFNKVMVGRKVEDEERWIKFNKVSGYINDESGFGFLNNTIDASGAICYRFDNTPYYFYDPISTIVSFEKTYCQDFYRTGILSGKETIVKQSVVNRELLGGGRYNTAIGTISDKGDAIVQGTISNTPYRAYNVTGLYNISGTATGIAKNGFLEVSLPSFVRPFN